MTTTHTNETKHTPGPWSHTPMKDTIWANDGETKVATLADLPWVTLSSGRRCSDDATEQANARLIAAAPELLAALERFTRWYEQNSVPDLQGVACDAFQAIAKAKGGV